MPTEATVLADQLIRLEDLAADDDVYILGRVVSHEVPGRGGGGGGLGGGRGGRDRQIQNARAVVTGKDVEMIVSPIFDEITAALARGERVELRGSGAFTVKHRNARTGRNPRTGVSVDVHEKSVPFFKAGKELRERVNIGPKS